MAPAHPPEGPPLRFQGRLPYEVEQHIDDWGLTPTQQETYVEQFRRILEEKKVWRIDHDYYLLRRFLRARSYDLKLATAMWLNNVAFKQEFDVDNILENFHFQEKAPFLEAYPQGYHKCDKQGRPVYIQLLGQVDVAAMKKCTNEERMIKFHIQEYERCGKVILPVCSRIAGRNIDQTFGIMDVKNVGLKHLSGEVKRLLGVITKYDQDNYPEMLGHICVINAPWVFRTIWSVVKGMLDARTQTKIEILDTNYLPAVLKWVDKKDLPDWLGGDSRGTLLDDVGPWSDDRLVASLGLGTLDEIHKGHLRQPNVREQKAEAPKANGTVSSAAVSSQPRNAPGDTHTPSPLSSSSPAASRPPPSKQLPPSPAVTKPRSIMQRVATLEQQCPQVKDKHASNGVNVNTGGSTRSAIEGSLLYRVEVLEEAMEVLLASQEATHANQKKLEAAQAAAKDQVAAGGGCCVVM